MKFIEILRTVFINIITNKVRVFLTALGIIVGAFTIVMVVGIGEGSQEAVKKQYSQLNAAAISVSQGFSQARGRSMYASLTETDLNDIKSDCPSVKSACMVYNGSTTITYDNNTSDASVAAVTEDFANVNSLSLSCGDFITNEDDTNKRKVVVIGYDIVSELFDGDSNAALGSQVTIKGKKYKVVGVLNRVGDSTGGMSMDETAIFPLNVGYKYIIGRRPRLTITALAKDVNSVSTAVDEITQVIETNHKDDADSFSIRDAGSRLTAAQSSAKTLSVLLISIAAIVLFVGGIGIMNVLLVSVKERTREIGILKAIGARKKVILQMFLLESIFISTAGGLIGVALGIFAPLIIKHFNISFVSTYYGDALALLFSIGTGTFFGYYPAKKAANLKPIDALNYE